MGLALSKGFSPRPLSVLELRGHKLELRLLEIADKEEVDEFIIGLPRSHNGKETPQSNKSAASLDGSSFELLIACRNMIFRWWRGPKVIIGFITYIKNYTRSNQHTRGLRVYLQDEHGSSLVALDYMIEMGLKKSALHGRIKAYAAMMVLERDFSTSGTGAELVLSKQSDLQEKLLQSPCRELDF